MRVVTAQVAEGGERIPVAAAAHRRDVVGDHHVLAAGDVLVPEAVGRLDQGHDVGELGIDLPRHVAVGRHGEQRGRDAQSHCPFLMGRLSWAEAVQGEIAVDVVEHHLERHADRNRVRRDVDQARRHAWSFRELDVRNRVGRVGLVRGCRARGGRSRTCTRSRRH